MHSFPDAAGDPDSLTPEEISFKYALISSGVAHQSAILSFCLALLKRKDMTLYRHSHNVRIIGSRLACELGLEERKARAVELGCLLHDIGKVVVPDVVLKKPGRYDDLEYLTMREHTIAGYELLREIDRFFPHEVLDIVLFHHEKIGGGGYPTNSQALPLHAEIAAICDIASAMQEHRHYRAGYGLDAAISEVLKFTWRKEIDLIANQKPNVFRLADCEKWLSV